MTLADTARISAEASVSQTGRVAMTFGALAVAVAPLLIADDYQLRFLAEIFIVGIAVLSLDLLVGYGGLVSLGHAALFGAAAYMAALVSQRIGADVLVMLAAGIITGITLAVLFGVVLMRTINLFFLILSLILGQMVWEVIFHWRDVTGGADGLRGFPTLTLHAGFMAVPLVTGRALYILTGIVAGVALLAARSFIRAPLGRALIGSRERALRMSALGYSIPRIRILALIVSGAIAGAAGSLYPFVNQYIGPNSAHWTMSAAMIIMLVIGGVGSLYGAFVGAAIYLTMQTYLSSYTDRWQLLVGLIFVLTVLLMPQGVVNGLKSASARVTRGKDSSQ